MFRAALAGLLFALPVSAFGVPITSDSAVAANGVGPLADQSASGPFDFDESFVSATRNVVIANRPAFMDSELSSDSARYGDSTVSAQPGLIGDRLKYLSANLMLLAAGLTLIWYLSRYGLRSSKRRVRGSARARRGSVIHWRSHEARESRSPRSRTARYPGQRR